MTEIFLCDNPEKVEDVKSRNSRKVEFAETEMVSTDITDKFSDFPVLGVDGDCNLEQFGLALKIENLSCDKGWSYTKFILYKNNKELCKIYRNYHSGPFVFVKHPNGNTYFVCGFDYQGMTVVNINEERVTHYLPEDAFKGSGWCMASFKKFDKEEKSLTVDGCYWACSYERRVFDFENPENLPWKILRDESKVLYKEWEDEDDEEEEENVSETE